MKKIQEEREENEETAIRHDRIDIRIGDKNNVTKWWNDFSPIVVPDIAGARLGIRNSSRGVSSAFIESLIDFLSLSVRRSVSAVCVRRVARAKTAATRPRNRTRNYGDPACVTASFFPRGDASRHIYLARHINLSQGWSALIRPRQARAPLPARRNGPPFNQFPRYKQHFSSLLDRSLSFRSECSR